MGDEYRFQQLIKWVKENKDFVPEEFLNIEEFGRWHKPVCAECQIGMVPDINGISLIDMYLDPPEPYQIWSADLWYCPICNHRIVDGYGNAPTQHHQDGFKTILELSRNSVHIYNFEKIEHAIAFIEINGQDLLSGKFVDIYQKPLTGEDYEGRAMLLEKMGHEDELGTQHWIVEFPNREQVERTICARFANAGAGG